MYSGFPDVTQRKEKLILGKNSDASLQLSVVEIPIMCVVSDSEGVRK